MSKEDQDQNQVLSGAGEESTNERRLGLLQGIDGVDQENVPLFAKISRLAGLAVVVAFVWWGLSESYPPHFEALAREFGVRYGRREAFSYGIAGAVLLGGWFARFWIGNLFFVAIFALWGVLVRLFRSV